MRKVTVIGLGYIGLPTSVIFAKNGWEVSGVDVNEEIVKKLNNAQVHIEEPGLDKALKEVVELNNFKAQLKPEESDVFIITVSTPQKSDKTVDLSNVISATKSILPVLKKGDLVILESTVPPRTTLDVVVPILSKGGFSPGEDINVSFCPERVLPGNILHELVYNNRIVGGINHQSTQAAKEAYKTFVKGKIIETTSENAEMSKLMENTYRDVNIALANELVKVTENLSIDPLEVIKLANEHPRVNIHQPGPGVGGHCIAVDPYFIIEKDKINTRIIQGARDINESMPSFVLEQVEKMVIPGETVTLFGLAYKGNVDDMRNSPTIIINKHLKESGYKTRLHDPFFTQEKTDIKLYSAKEALKDSSLLIILTDHSEFKDLTRYELQSNMKKNLVFDTKAFIEDYEAQTTLINFSNLEKMGEKNEENNASLWYKTRSN